MVATGGTLGDAGKKFVTWGIPSIGFLGGVVLGDPFDLASYVNTLSQGVMPNLPFAAAFSYPHLAAAGIYAILGGIAIGVGHYLIPGGSMFRVVPNTIAGITFGIALRVALHAVVRPVVTSPAGASGFPQIVTGR